MYSEQIAIVGMAAVLPSAGTLDSYWRNLVDGVDAITDVPAHRWDPEFYDPGQAHRPDRLYCRRGGFIDEFAAFEPLTFGITPASVKSIEPDHLIAVQVAAAAIDDAGGPDRMADGDRVGVIIGRSGILSPAQARYAQRVRTASQVVQILRELIPDLAPEALERVRERFDERLGKHQPEHAIGHVSGFAASLVANRLNLGGPAYTLDAACASSLIAVDQAVAELASGRLDAVLVGGVHHVHDISFWSMFSQSGALSRSGQSRPFDVGADGLLIGEGTGIVVLKRLSDARRDGDRVYAVIRGSGVSSGGRATGMFNPDTSGQVPAIRRAWSAAGLDPTAPDALGMLEAHGIATPTGDIAELATIMEVFGPYRDGPRPVLGSVKSMIGHTMATAGIAGLIKAALAIYRGVLLPTLHCDTPRPALERTRFTPIATAQPWESDEPRRAGVNAFGFGGINAHIILEEAPDALAARRGENTAGVSLAGFRTAPAAGTPTRHAAAATVDEPEQVLWLAAPDPVALLRLLDTDDAAVRALGTARSREAGSVPGASGPALAPDERCRLGIVDPDERRLATARRAVASGQPWRGARDVWFNANPLLAGPVPGKLAFVFPGLEAEFTPRTADLAAHFGLPDREWSASDLGRHGAGLVEAGLLFNDALHRIGITPDAIAGHSIGEWAAGVTSGQISPASMVEFLADFGVASCWELPGYAFAALGAGADEVTPVLARYPGTVLSHDNAPSQCLVNGPEAEVERLVVALRREGILCQQLPFRSAFHTPVFASGREAILAAVRHWQVHPTRVPVWSATLRAPYPDDDPAQVVEVLARHLLEPVWFRQTVAAMYDAGIRVFLQVGAGQLASVIADNLRGRDYLAMPVNVPHRSGLDQLRRVATALWVEGGAPDLHAFDRPGGAGTRPALTLTAEAARRAAVMKLDLGGSLVRLGEQAAELLGVTVSTGGQSSQEPTVRPASFVAPQEIRPPRTGDTAAAADAHRTVLRVCLDTMPHLRDHCFFVQPDDWPDPQDRWPVVPATTIMQHMSDAVAQVASGMRIVAVRDARFHRWCVAAPPQDVKIIVKPARSGEFAVTFGTYAQATIEVAADNPTDVPQPWRHSPATERRPEIGAEEIYAQRLLFHGPLFQGVTRAHAVGEHHVRAVISAPAPPGALLDNALHLVGLWLVATQPSRVAALPVRIGHARFYGQPVPPGTTFECVARIRAIDDAEVVADLQLLLGDRVWAQLDRCVGRRFEIGRYEERFPERYPISQRQPEGWTMAFDRWTDLVARNMAARRILGARGYADYERQPPRTRKQWMLGRIAAKDAVRLQLWDDGHTDVYPIELTVTNDSNGRPRVRSRAGRGFRDCDISLAHTGEIGVAIATPRIPGASPDDPGVGIDVAEVTDHPDSTIQFTLSEGERALLDSLVTRTGEERRLWFIRFWVAKEAVGKAEGTGLAGNPRRFTVVAATSANLTVHVAERVYHVEHRQVHNPDDPSPREYVVGWTWGPQPAPAGSMKPPIAGRASPARTVR